MTKEINITKIGNTPMPSPEQTKKYWVSATIFFGITILALLIFLSYRFGQKSIQEKTPKAFKPTTPEQTTALQNTPIDPPQVFAREGKVKKLEKNAIIMEAKFRVIADEFAVQEIKVKITKDTKFIKIEGNKESPVEFNDLKKDDKIIASSLNNIKNQPEFTANFIQILK